MECKKCNSELQDDYIYCCECGCRTDGKKDCPSCKCVLEQDVKFCPSCGVVQRGYKKCTCGKVLDDKLKFCPYCGVSFVLKKPNADSSYSSRQINAGVTSSTNNNSQNTKEKLSRIFNIISNSLLAGAIFIMFIFSFFSVLKVNTITNINSSPVSGNDLSGYNTNQSSIKVIGSLFHLLKGQEGFVEYMEKQADAWDTAESSKNLSKVNIMDYVVYLYYMADENTMNPSYLMEILLLSIGCLIYLISTAVMLIIIIYQMVFKRKIKVKSMLVPFVISLMLVGLVKICGFKVGWALSASIIIYSITLFVILAFKIIDNISAFKDKKIILKVASLGTTFILTLITFLTFIGKSVKFVLSSSTYYSESPTTFTYKAGGIELARVWDNLTHSVYRGVDFDGAIALSVLAFIVVIALFIIQLILLKKIATNLLESFDESNKKKSRLLSLTIIQVVFFILFVAFTSSMIAETLSDTGSYGSTKYILKYSVSGAGYVGFVFAILTLVTVATSGIINKMLNNDENIIQQNRYV